MYRTMHIPLLLLIWSLLCIEQRLWHTCTARICQGCQDFTFHSCEHGRGVRRADLGPRSHERGAGEGQSVDDAYKLEDRNVKSQFPRQRWCIDIINIVIKFLLHAKIKLLHYITIVDFHSNFLHHFLFFLLYCSVYSPFIYFDIHISKFIYLWIFCINARLRCIDVRQISFIIIGNIVRKYFYILFKKVSSNKN